MEKIKKTIDLIIGQHESTTITWGFEVWTEILGSFLIYFYLNLMVQVTINVAWKIIFYYSVWHIILFFIQRDNYKLNSHCIEKLETKLIHLKDNI